MSAARVAVVAVTHGSSHVLPGWIEALERSGHRELLELVVVDSGSSPEEVEKMRAIAAGRVEAFVSLPNVGFGSGCNAGAGATSAPTLLFTNPDCKICELPARALAGEGLDGAIVGGHAIGSGRRLGFAKYPGFGEEAQELALGRYSRAFARVEPGTEPAWVSGAALMVDRADFERIGGFSPSFFMYFEDADLCARHRLAGGNMRLDDELAVDHGSGKSTEPSRLHSIGYALDSVNHYSGRVFAELHGSSWQRPALYLLLIPYALRRALVKLTRERDSLAQLGGFFACLFSPRHALRRLGAKREDGTPWL